MSSSKKKNNVVRKLTNQAQNLPSLAEVRATTDARNYLEAFLNSSEGEEFFAHLAMELPDAISGTEELYQLLEVMVGRKAYPIPARMCPTLQGSVEDLDELIAEWPLRTPALPGRMGLCWFSGPLRIPTSAGCYVDLLGLVWTFGHLTDPDLSATISPRGMVRVTGIVRPKFLLDFDTEALNREGRPHLLVDWSVGTSYADVIRQRVGVSGTDILEEIGASMALLRVFATLLYMVQSMPIYTTETCLLGNLLPELKGVVQWGPGCVTGNGYVRS